MATDLAARRAPVVAALLLGAGVAVALGVYGRVHSGSYAALPSMGFPSVGAFKAWSTTVVLVLALSQLATACWLYGRLPGVPRPPGWLGPVHRAGGLVALVVSLPVAAFCLYGFGFAPEPVTTRTLVHSLAGCALYGAFAAKVLLVHSRRVPDRALPVTGAFLLTAVVALWWTGAVWFFDVQGVRG